MPNVSEFGLSIIFASDFESIDNVVNGKIYV